MFCSKCHFQHCGAIKWNKQDDYNFITGVFIWSIVPTNKHYNLWLMDLKHCREFSTVQRVWTLYLTVLRCSLNKSVVMQAIQGMNWVLTFSLNQSYSP